MDRVTARAQPDVWETPEFEEVEVAPEVTMYFGKLD